MTATALLGSPRGQGGAGGPTARRAPAWTALTLVGAVVLVLRLHTGGAGSAAGRRGGGSSAAGSACRRLLARALPAAVCCCRCPLLPPNTSSLHSCCRHCTGGAGTSGAACTAAQGAPPPLLTLQPPPNRLPAPTHAARPLTRLAPTSPAAPLQLPWAPLLSEEEQRQGVSHGGGGARLRAVARKLLAGQPITAVTLGGSITYGHGCDDLALAYPSRFFAFLNATWPHRCGGAARGAGAAVLFACGGHPSKVAGSHSALCLPSSLPRQRARAPEPRAARLHGAGAGAVRRGHGAAWR